MSRQSTCGCLLESPVDFRALSVQCQGSFHVFMKRAILDEFHGAFSLVLFISRRDYFSKVSDIISAILKPLYATRKLFPSSFSVNTKYYARIGGGGFNNCSSFFFKFNFVIVICLFFFFNGDYFRVIPV